MFHARWKRAQAALILGQRSRFHHSLPKTVDHSPLASLSGLVLSNGHKTVAAPQCPIVTGR